MTNEERLLIHDAKFVAIMDELKQQREDMRRLQDRQDQSMREMREFQAKQDAKLLELRKQQDADRLAAEEKTNRTYKELLDKIHSTFIQTMIGVGGMMIALGGALVAILK